MFLALTLVFVRFHVPGKEFVSRLGKEKPLSRQEATTLYTVRYAACRKCLWIFAGIRHSYKWCMCKGGIFLSFLLVVTEKRRRVSSTRVDGTISLLSWCYLYLYSFWTFLRRKSTRKWLETRGATDEQGIIIIWRRLANLKRLLMSITDFGHWLYVCPLRR